MGLPSFAIMQVRQIVRTLFQKMPEMLCSSVFIQVLVDSIVPQQPNPVFLLNEFAAKIVIFLYELFAIFQPDFIHVFTYQG